MRVLAACSLGGAGHLTPLLPYLVGARDLGHETLVVGPPAISTLVGPTGFPFQTGDEPPEDEVAPIREQLPVLPAAEASVLGSCQLFGRLAARAMLPAMERVCSEWVPDLILREPCEYSSAVVSVRTRTPAAQVAISVAEGEAASIRAAAPALEEHRVGLVDHLWSCPYLTTFPASLDPSPFPNTIRVRPTSGPASDRLPGWWESPDLPLVYVTFGTVLGYMSIAAGVYRAALQAVQHLEARVLLTVGGRFDQDQLGLLPSNVHVESWVEQARVFTEADLVVCHGGSGTAYGALAAGLPLVTVPVFADQFENSRRISAYGAGRAVEMDNRSLAGPRRPIQVEDAPQITAAIEAVLGDQSYRRQARRLAHEMAGAPPAREVLSQLLAGSI
jgi:UDP-glucoronosyl and UDP-glucosyl transferase